MAGPTVIDIANHAARQEAFLEAVIETGSISDAADRVGISRRLPYAWCEAEGYRSVADYEAAPEGTFAHAITQAKRLAGERAAGRIMHHALHSPGMPGVVAAIATAKRYDPGWNDSLNVRHSGTVTNVNVDLAAMPPADRARLFELAAAHERQKLLDHPVSPEE